MLKITIEELKKHNTIALHIEKRNETKMERLVEKKAIQEIIKFLSNMGKTRKTHSLFLQEKLIVENELKILYNKNINL